MNDLYVITKNQKTPYCLTELNVLFRDLSCLQPISAVLDQKGNILNFPGIVQDERWVGKHRIGQCYDVRFEAQFYSLKDDEFLMLWLIQPNGWHWVDEDGFGFTGDSEITLYSVLTKNGEFTRKFELFRIDKTVFCHDYDDCLAPIGSKP